MLYPPLPLPCGNPNANQYGNSAYQGREHAYDVDESNCSNEFENVRHDGSLPMVARADGAKGAKREEHGEEHDGSSHLLDGLHKLLAPANFLLPSPEHVFCFHGFVFSLFRLNTYSIA